MNHFKFSAILLWETGIFFLILGKLESEGSQRAWQYLFLKYRNTSECFTHTYPLFTHSESRLQTSCQRATLKRRLGHRGEVSQAVQSTNPRGSDRFGFEEWGSVSYLEDRILKSHSGSVKTDLLAGSPSTLLCLSVCLFVSFFLSFQISTVISSL